MELKFKEISADDKNYIEQIIEIEKEAFGINGGVDEWILKPMIRYGKVYILLLEDEVIGICEYIRSFSGKIMFLYGFSVKSNYRKKGFGKLMLEKSVEIFKEYDIEEISLTTPPENILAIKLYEKIGFENKGLLENEYGKGIHRLNFVKRIKVDKFSKI